MIAIVSKNMIVSTSELFGQLLESKNKMLLRHLCFTKVDFSIKLVLGCFGVNDDNSALFVISRNHTITVLLATDYVKVIVT